ncbi:MAG: threonine synthase [bacterium]|nr:threonine synthase [bacterium]
MPYRAWFECFAGCGERYPLDEIVYECRACGELLEVRHDMDALRQTPPEEWRRIWDGRYRRTEWPYGSGVWGKKEMVCPNVADRNIVSLYEGGTNLFRAARLGGIVGLENLWIKLCGNEHTGSFKDLGMTVLVSMVNQMIADGADILGVACASTGDTSAALAAYCAAAGIQAIVFLPRGRVSTAQLIQPIAHGALTLSLDTDFDGCMELIRRICRRENVYLANSMNSLRVEGQKTVAVEIVQQLDWQVPDWIVIPGGNLGNVSALGKGFLEMRELGIIDRLPRIACAQAARANPLYRSYRTGFAEFRPVKAESTAATAIQIGNPVSVRKAIKVLRTFDGVVEEATEDELANACALADRTGLYVCPHTGVALAALMKLAAGGLIGSSNLVVVISTAHGLKFSESKIRYHEGKLPGVSPRHANLPVELPADYDAVRDAILGAVGRRGRGA